MDQLCIGISLVRLTGASRFVITTLVPLPEDDFTVIVSMKLSIMVNPIPLLSPVSSVV